MNRQQVTLTLCQRRQLAAYRAQQQEAHRAAERASFLCRRASRLPRRASKATTARVIVGVVLWLVVMACGLWLAAHDPATLSRAAERAIGGAA